MSPREVQQRLNTRRQRCPLARMDRHLCCFGRALREPCLQLDWLGHCFGMKHEQLHRLPWSYSPVVTFCLRMLTNLTASCSRSPHTSWPCKSQADFLDMANSRTPPRARRSLLLTVPHWPAGSAPDSWQSSCTLAFRRRDLSGSLFATVRCRGHCAHRFNAVGFGREHSSRNQDRGCGALTRRTRGTGALAGGGRGGRHPRRRFLKACGSR